MDEKSTDKFLATGLTFDDVLIAPRYSTVVPSEVDILTTHSTGIRQTAVAHTR